MTFPVLLAFSWYTGLEWLYWLLLMVVLITGLALNILGTPGLWLMLLGHVLFGIVTGWNLYVGWPSTLILFGLASAAEVVELVAGAAGSAKAGGTRRGMLAAIAGGFVGGILGSIFIPVLILGTLAGMVIGSFAAAALVEWIIHPDHRRALRIGIGAAKGRLMGTVIKTLFGVLMLIVSLAAALPIGGGTVPPSAIAPPPATLPAP